MSRLNSDGGVVSKTLIAIDEDLLTRTKRILGTSTKKDTVNGALREVVRRNAAEELIAMGHAGIYDEVLDREVVERAWRG
jgi:Arc/MetJ family transcription regulator